MKKTATFILLIFFITSINTYAGSGEGISSVGTLSSFNHSNTIIITHGFTADYVIVPIEESKWKDFIWQFAMANAVSNNRDIYFIRKGRVLKAKATYEQYVEFTSVYPEVSIEILLNNSNYFIDENNSQFGIDSHRDNVFIFDWTLESAVNKHGFAEAAADILAAELIKLGKVYPFLLEHLHFIGHSRGCVVNSEAIERLIYWASEGLLPNGVNIDPAIHMTTLDPHPAGHWHSNIFTAMKDDEVNKWNSSDGPVVGVTGWKAYSHTVEYIDNYWQNKLLSAFQGLSNYPGLDNTNIISNIDLTQVLPTITANAHSLVHTWYHGTVSSLDSNDIFNVGERNIERTNWYFFPDLGKTQGFYRSVNRPGFLPSISSIEENLKSVTNDTKYGTDNFIFNGNFTKGWGAITYFDSLAGWSFQDGISPKLSGVFNPSALLNDNNNILVHNSLYFPENIQIIYFTMRVYDTSEADFLNLYVGNNLIRHIPIDHFILTKQWFDAVIPNSIQGTVDQIKFELTKTDQNFGSILIDDVSFVPNEEIRSTVACPVDFHIYDNLGNHTGPINDSTIVEEIPGSEYYIYEDSTGDKIKTVYLQPLEDNANYTFVIQSEDTTASFSYEIEDYSDTSKPTTIYQFTDIAIEPNTVATCTLDVNIQVPQLNVDIDGDGNIDSIYTPVVITSIEENEIAPVQLPTKFELFNCYPNPFNPSTTIRYSIPQNSKVTLRVYDVLGEEIVTLVNEEKSPGNYSVQFNSLNISSGIYFYTLQTDSYTSTKKMILLK